MVERPSRGPRNHFIGDRPEFRCRVEISPLRDALEAKSARRSRGQEYIGRPVQYRSGNDE